MNNEFETLWNKEVPDSQTRVKTWNEDIPNMKQEFVIYMMHDVTCYMSGNGIFVCMIVLRSVH
jgi:hypothetical protein